MSKVEDAKDKAVLLWTLGLSTSAIAERVGVRQSTVNHWIKVAGLRKPGDPPRPRYDGVGGGSGLRARPRLSP